ncbi:MAG TPA: hypothetical protein VL989_03970 [Candidatus Sulfotelmatobacter sp.]|nr:hypothetical protein [Candidatus Sulfotelmatobacter sp.]
MGRLRQEKETAILSQQLLVNIAEELKMPLIRIARANELSMINDDTSGQQVIKASTESALKLIDNYILGIRLALEDKTFNIESVSVSSVLYDAAVDLSSLAKLYNVDLELNIAGKFGPVIANRQALHAALVSLGTSLIEAIPAHDKVQTKLQLATHRSRYGVVAGMYAETKQLSSTSLQMGRRLYKSSRQPLVNVSYGSGAGVFVADSILHSIGLKLIASRHHNLYGIGAVLHPLNQMQLV